MNGNSGLLCYSTEPQGSNSEQTAAVLKTPVGQLRGATRGRSWLRQCAISRNVAGSIPSGVIIMFHWHNPSDPGVYSASNRNEISLGGKGGRCVWLTTLPHSSANPQVCTEITWSQVEGRKL